jgi:hypothetical protein
MPYLQAMPYYLFAPVACSNGGGGGGIRGANTIAGWSVLCHGRGLPYVIVFLGFFASCLIIRQSTSIKSSIRFLCLRNTKNKVNSQSYKEILLAFTHQQD